MNIYRLWAGMLFTNAEAIYKIPGFGLLGRKHLSGNNSVELIDFFKHFSISV